MPCKRSHSRSGQPVNAICSNQTSSEEDLMKPQSMRAPTADHFHRGLAAVVSLAVGGAFLVLWFWLLPGWLGFTVEMAGAARWRWLAAIPSALGFAVASRCIWDFGWAGRGTPAPVVPPKKLVVVGFYRHVRNPMYVGFAAGRGRSGGIFRSAHHAG